MFFKILLERISIFFVTFYVFFLNYFLSIFELMNFLKLGIGLLDSLYRHINDSEDIDITIFSNISLKFAIDFIF